MFANFTTKIGHINVRPMVMVTGNFHSPGQQQKTKVLNMSNTWQGLKEVRGRKRSVPFVKNDLGEKMFYKGSINVYAVFTQQF